MTDTVVEGAKHIARLRRRADTLQVRIVTSPQQADFADEQAELKSLNWVIAKLSATPTLAQPVGGGTPRCDLIESTLVNSRDYTPWRNLAYELEASLGEIPSRSEAPRLPVHGADDSHATIESGGSRLQGPHGGLKGAMPNPTGRDLVDPLFNAIWDVTKRWDVNAPDYYDGYCGMNGSHVMLIVNAIRTAPAPVVGELVELIQRLHNEAQTWAGDFVPPPIAVLLTEAAAALERLAGEGKDTAGYRSCEFCGCRTNAHLRRCCDKGYNADAHPSGGGE